MGITTTALSVIAANMIGSSLATHVAIGTGSSTFTSGQTTLLTEVERNQITTQDLSAAEQITFIANWSPVEMSGLSINEFGTFTSGTGGNMLNREILTTTETFDGESELQVQQTYKFII